MKGTMEILKALRSDLEDQFFRAEDEKLIEQYRVMKEMKETEEALSSVSGIQNRKVLQKLVSLDVHPETLASLAVVPLVEVAWADGAIDDREREAVLSGADKAGFKKGDIDYKLLDRWLLRKPDAHLLEAWVHYMEGLCELLSVEEREALKDELIGHSRAVAEASGGFLGLGNKVSAAEQKMLDRLGGAFCAAK